MKNIEERVFKIAKYMVSEKATIKQASIFFGVSESTVYKDMTERLPRLNPVVASAVRELINTNKTKRRSL